MSFADFVRALEGKSQLEITVRGRKTKIKRSAIVWFVLEGNLIYLLPVSGSDTNWYKNILKDPNIKLTVNGRFLKAKAKPIIVYEHVQRVIKLFAEKYGGMSEIKRWYSKLDVAAEIY